MPRMSTPLLVSKRLSSIEITASLTICGICPGVTITRFCWLSTPIGWPRSSSSIELWASLNCEKLGQRRQVGGDDDEHAEHERDEAEQQHGEEDRQRTAAASGAACVGGRYVGAIVIAHRRLRSEALRATRRPLPTARAAMRGGTVGPSRRRESSIGPHAERHRRGRRGSRRLAAELGNAVDSLPDGALAREAARGARRRAARCA